MHKHSSLALLATALVLGAVSPVLAGGMVDWSKKAGKTITVEGAISQERTQHLGAEIFGEEREFRLTDGSRAIVHFKLAASDPTASHAREPIDCPGRMSVTGKVVEVKSASEKAGGDYREYHLAANSWKCLTQEPVSKKNP